LILLDANILIYAFRQDTEHHGEYRAWFEEALGKVAAVGIAELVLSSVVRITTHPKIFVKPSTLDEVFQFVDYIRSFPNVVNVLPGRTHWSIFQRLCRAVPTLLPSRSKKGLNGSPAIEISPAFRN